MQKVWETQFGVFLAEYIVWNSVCNNKGENGGDGLLSISATLQNSPAPSKKNKKDFNFIGTTLLMKCILYVTIFHVCVLLKV